MPNIPATPPRPAAPHALRSQLIVTTKSDLMARYGAAPIEDTAADVCGSRVSALFGPSYGHVHDEYLALRGRGVRVPDLSVFFAVNAPEAHYAELVRRLRRLPHVTGAYVKPPADAPDGGDAYSCEETFCTPLSSAPAATPPLVGSQGYLDPAHAGGIDARYAWTRAGGKGDGVEIVDVEREWRFTHEDLVGSGGLAGGFPVNCIRERNHGAAILGILHGDDNAFGITGICPKANVRGMSTRQPGVAELGIPGTADTAKAIRDAANLLSANGARPNTGHLIVLELQRVGPGGYDIPVEWWWDDFAAIQFATGLGLIVVEAAGNGHPTLGEGTSLDDARYQARDPSFPAQWNNPLRRAANGVDSGAILVGAGAPPTGTVRVARSRLRYSNWGKSVDAQGWGDEVVTAGYGCMQGGPSEDRWYLGDFGGTSAATAMVAGALACAQGFLREKGHPLLTPAAARALVRAHGSKQQKDGAQYPVSQRIGPLPNLRAMIGAAGKRARPRRRR